MNKLQCKNINFKNLLHKDEPEINKHSLINYQISTKRLMLLLKELIEASEKKD